MTPKQRAINAFNRRLKLNDNHAESRNVKVTAIRAGLPHHEAVLTLSKPQVNWATLTEAICIPPTQRLAIQIKMIPFKSFQVAHSNDIPDMPALFSALLEGIVFN